MRAVIVATSAFPGTDPLDDRYPRPMLRLANRPFIQHVVEFLAARGVTEFHWVLSHFPEQIEDFLGGGARWGSKFVYHLARDPFRPYGVVRTIFPRGHESEQVLFGHADRLPPLRASDLACGAAPALFYWRESGEKRPGDPGQWTGWACLSARDLANLPGDVDENGLNAYLLSANGNPPCRHEVGRPLSVQTCGDMLASQRALFEKQFQGLLLGAREIDPGIWLARNVALHPSANLVPPVYVGENCRIDSEVELGPGVAVGDDCVLDTGCQLTNSVIFPGSYVGEGVKLTDKIVDKDRLVNARFGTVVTVADHYILGSITDRLVPRSVRNWISRVRGYLLLLPALPVLLLTILFLKVFRRQPVLNKKTAVRLPSSQGEADWIPYTLWSFCPFKTDRETSAHHRASLRNFLLCFLPGLVNVARGNLNLVGVPPRSPEEIKALKPDWQFLYLQAKAGLVTEAAVCYGENPSEEELYASEAHYAVTGGWWRDLRILARYFGRVFFGIFLPRRG